VLNGLTLNGTALIGHPTSQLYGKLDFSGSQTLGGSGTVVFGNQPTPDVNMLRVPNLTFATHSGF
jgi:hypothetical protein